MQGTAKAIVPTTEAAARHPNLRQQSEPAGGKTPKPPQAQPADRISQEHPKRAKGRGQTPPGAKNFTGQKSGREKREEDGEEEAREERKEKTGENLVLYCEHHHYYFHYTISTNIIGCE